VLPRPAPAGLDADWAREADVARLFEAILRLRDATECAAFFRDLCTIPEIVTLAHRWQVAQLLDQELPYQEIARRTGASTATITRINAWRRFGTGGYRLALDRLRTEAR
jgi:TrpR-related protein YerC/YecD